MYVVLLCIYNYLMVFALLQWYISNDESVSCHNSCINDRIMPKHDSEPEDMSVDKGKRSVKAYMGHLTRAITEGETVLGRASVRPIEVRNAIAYLQTRWSSYEEAYQKLESALLESDCEEEELERVQVEFYELKAKYQQILYTLTDKETPVQDGVSVNQNETVVSTSTKLELPNI